MNVIYCVYTFHVGFGGLWFSHLSAASVSSVTLSTGIAFTITLTDGRKRTENEPRRNRPNSTSDPKGTRVNAASRPYAFQRYCCISICPPWPLFKECERTRHFWTIRSRRHDRPFNLVFRHDNINTINAMDRFFLWEFFLCLGRSNRVLPTDWSAVGRAAFAPCRQTRVRYGGYCSVKRAVLISPSTVADRGFHPMSTNWLLSNDGGFNTPMAETKGRLWSAQLRKCGNQSVGLKPLRALGWTRFWLPLLPRAPCSLPRSRASGKQSDLKWRQIPTGGGEDGHTWTRPEFDGKRPAISYLRGIDRSENRPVEGYVPRPDSALKTFKNHTQITLQCKNE